MNTLKALLISDGLPGHYRLAEGILAAVARRRAVDTVRLEVRRRKLAPQRLLAGATSSGLSPHAVMRLAYGLDAGSLPAADLVVSAGGNTLAANIAAARTLDVPNVFYGSLRRFDPAAFTLALSSYERAAPAPSMAMTLKPSAFDPDTLPPLTSRLTHDRLPERAGLLIGGDTPTIRFTERDWQQLLAFLVSTHARGATRWTVSNSRRTPAEASALMAALAQQPNGPLAGFIDVNTPGGPPLTELFAASDLVLCTADSSSMVSEAIWTRRPVIAVTPRSMQLTGAEAGYRRYLENEGWLCTLPIAELTLERIAAAAAGMTPLEENPLDRLAALLAQRLATLLPTGRHDHIQC